VLAALLREVVGHIESSTFRALPTRVFPASEVADAFRHMARAKHVGRVAVSIRAKTLVLPRSRPPALFRADATYLITGGLEGFGLATAHWMAKQGARSLVLVGRRGRSTPGAERSIDLLESTGVRVVVAAADVADPDQCADVLAQVRRSDAPPLRGVVHSAMVYDDALIEHQTEERLRKVLAPKVRGAWNLHRLTSDDPLEFFVLYSSSMAVIGNQGQSNYMAANAFVDALAHFRRARGRPAIAVNWGGISDVGAVSRREDGHRLTELLGMELMPAHAALAVLGSLLTDGPPQIGVMPIDWRQWASTYPHVASRPQYAHLTASRGSGDAAGRTHGTAGAFHPLPTDPRERRNEIMTRLRACTAQVLGTTEIEADRSLSTLGLDSLMAAELSILIRRSVGLEVPMVRLVAGPSISELATFLCHSAGAPATRTHD
jgi:NAD(P)-dependent dehydrogenase (short-subunit alcohol dehydrogenase family)/acyl carrier protein